MSEEMTSETENEESKPKLVKSAADLQRLKIEKLMKNPDKPVLIPERPKEKSFPNAPDFVRNVMGSSAGAGSGEFHVYRHLRRKEYARQKHIQEKSAKDVLNDEYHERIEANKRKADEKTAKKRAKRLKKKAKIKEKRLKPKDAAQASDESEKSDSDSDIEETENKTQPTENE